MSEAKKGCKPCSVLDNFVEPCSTLDKALAPEVNRRGKGLNMLVYSDMRTGKPTRSLVTLNSGEFKHPGIILNHCPFCGNKLFDQAEAEL